VRKLKKKIQPGRCMHRWEVNVKMNLKRKRMRGCGLHAINVHAKFWEIQSKKIKIRRQTHRMI
jgi:hypothetical protein